MTHHNHHIGHGLDELDQLNDILYDLYVSDEVGARYDTVELSAFKDNTPQGLIH